MLVVDDDHAIRSLVAMVLIEEGYVVEEAADGLDALEAVARTLPDVVVLDYQMPRCDGPEFAQRFRGQERGVPIVLMTAAGDVHERCRRVSADGCIAKPFDIDELVSAVHEQTHAHADYLAA